MVWCVDCGYIKLDDAEFINHKRGNIKDHHETYSSKIYCYICAKIKGEFLNHQNYIDCSFIRKDCLALCKNCGLNGKDFNHHPSHSTKDFNTVNKKIIK
jgi:hypothetical protein